VPGTWHLQDFERFEIKRFDEEAVVFDRRDGRTHYLSPVALVIFSALGVSEHSQEDLFELIQHALGVVLASRERSHVRTILDQLRALDIVACDCA